MRFRRSCGGGGVGGSGSHVGDVGGVGVDGYGGGSCVVDAGVGSDGDGDDNVEIANGCARVWVGVCACSVVLCAWWRWCSSKPKHTSEILHSLKKGREILIIPCYVR